MKKLSLALLAAIMSLVLAIPANAAEYSTFVGCDDLAESPVPSHVCQVGDFPAAFFESDVDTEYEVCLEFPDKEEICLEEQFAEAETLFLNSMLVEEEGDYLVSWYVEGVEIGFWAFRLDAPPPPPPPAVAPPPAPAAPAPPVIQTGPSATCLGAERRVGALKKRLRNASSRKQKAKIRTKLRNARAAARRAC